MAVSSASRRGNNVNYRKLTSQIWNMGIREKKLICIISEMLKAPILMHNREKIHTAKGTPQGGILSPLLSNIVLNELDWWIASQWELCPPTIHINYVKTVMEVKVERRFSCHYARASLKKCISFDMRMTLRFSAALAKMQSRYFMQLNNG